MNPPTLLLGDCIEQMQFWLPDNSVDAIVTDPPYGLTQGKKGGTGVASVNLNSPYGRARIGTGNGAGGFMGLKWDGSVPSVEVWAECLRVLKPGGYLLAFAGTRTQHRMCVNIEDAGFEIRDMIAWIYGSGFPKSLDVSKAIDKAAGAERTERLAPKAGHENFVGRDNMSALRESGALSGEGGFSRPWMFDPEKVEAAHWNFAPATEAARQWQGWGTALKPALEPITVARKPLGEKTVVDNVLRWGTGGLNIDGCRVGNEVLPEQAKIGTFERGVMITPERVGRWPANLIHDGSDEVVSFFPDAKGQLANVYGKMRRESEPSANSDNEGAVGFNMKPGARRLDSGSAARFFYAAKASKADRNSGGANHHPTVKPTDLMRYLCRLVTQPGGVVLDPYMGSGSTGKAARLEGFDFIGIERDPDYMRIAEARIK